MRVNYTHQRSCGKCQTESYRIEINVGVPLRGGKNSGKDFCCFVSCDGKKDKRKKRCNKYFRLTFFLRRLVKFHFFFSIGCSSFFSSFTSFAWRWGWKVFESSKPARRLGLLCKLSNYSEKGKQIILMIFCVSLLMNFSEEFPWKIQRRARHIRIRLIMTSINMASDDAMGREC